MATVDFTLEDIGRQTEGIVERSITKALVKEHVNTRTLVEEIVEEVMVREFTNLWDDNLRPMLDEMRDDIKDLKRIAARHGRMLDQHSKDIMELRSKQA